MTRQRRSGEGIVVSPYILSLGEALSPPPGDTGASPGGDAGALRSIPHNVTTAIAHIHHTYAGGGNGDSPNPM